MSRPPVIPAEKKIRIVLSVLQGEVSIAEAARREKVSEQAIGNWKRQFLEGGKAGIEAGKSKPTSREPRNAAPPHCRSPARPGTRTWPPSASTPASKTPGKKTPPPNSPSEEDDHARPQPDALHSQLPDERSPMRGWPISIWLPVHRNTSKK